MKYVGLVRSVVLTLFIVSFAGVAHAEDLRVQIDEAQLIRLPSAGAEVIVGNPSIADVTVRSSKLLVVTGKSFGLTNVIVLDAAGEEILDKKISVSADQVRMVTLRKGVLRYSLHCTPVCQSPLVVGDYAAHFEQLKQATISKMSTASAAVTGAAPAQGPGQGGGAIGGAAAPVSATAGGGVR